LSFRTRIHRECWKENPPFAPTSREALALFQLRLRVTDVYVCPDRDVVIAEYVSDGYVTTTGKPYENRYIGVFVFRGENVSWQREFYNPLPARQALS
jgi:ketosteroid isomerase-like protein